MGDGFREDYELPGEILRFCIVAPLDSAETYLRTKKTKPGHLLEEF